MKTLRFLSVLILIAGACLTGRAVYLHAKAKLAGFLIRRAWEQTAHTGEPRSPWLWADAHPIARLRIPRLAYDEIVLDDATPRTLAFGPALLLSGALIGKPGNVVLAGHRDTWFLPLEKIAALRPLARAATRRLSVTCGPCSTRTPRHFIASCAGRRCSTWSRPEGAASTLNGWLL